MDLNKLKKYHQKYVHNQYNPKTVKRVYIPKGKDKTRRLLVSQPCKLESEKIKGQE
ncbi:MAG: hypothetical protein Q8894_02660 [Sweet potato little leaf phytoplasma]|uniref:hypothetical protein n=1 Tax=16SrII (Peanut WB group) TaxID=85621 RepID=UPI00039FD015|nr:MULTISPECIES: hypothetical protein [16SrII (Peanut WB group)]MDV3145715.1 hypothetical protein [Sweet potato little leaf phytoplasma]QLL36832.1 RNA-directed DNA polymerase ['Echinacea purpurea' witches'-broom phytoplasma]WEX20496.1 MAG: RNA-directed DNA polymerase [Candidatus Phytoplasma aurantifolia]WKV64079.1 MAG: RNA-directed DNA polymerase [Candidatus Phytoplasma australasiaticum]MDO8055202.1 hypothetical protein ['Cleome sp.' phytoplasma]